MRPGDLLTPPAPIAASWLEVRARVHSLADDHPAWDTVAHALAQMCHLLVATVAPRRILIGGGVVSGHPHLFPRIRRLLLSSLNGYLHIPEMLDDIDHFVAPPGLKALAGPLGSLAIAGDALSVT